MAKKWAWPSKHFLACAACGLLPPRSKNPSYAPVVVGPEGMSPSSHWKVAIAPSVVPDTVVLEELGGNSGAPQSTRQVQLCLTRIEKNTH